MATLINIFEVPAGAEEQFIAGWERARDFIDAKGAVRSTALHRSLMPEAEFRFVNVAEIDSVDEWRDAVTAAEFPRVTPGVPHPALYEVISEDPVPTPAKEGVILINAFEVPAGKDAQFLVGWERVRDFMRNQPGYLGTRLHRSLAPDAEFRFVNRGTFRTPEEFTNAITHPAFPGRHMPFIAHPMLYEVVRR